MFDESFRTVFAQCGPDVAHAGCEGPIAGRREPFW